MPLRPDLSYLVMGTPRSGSSLLCDLLSNTGVAGHPAEYFWRDTMAELARQWDVSDEWDYVRRVLEAGATPNGVFGAKVMWTYLDDVLSYLGAVRGGKRPADKSVLAEFFPDLRFVWIWRDDVVAQGVSWAKAELTNEWYAGDPRSTGTTPAFDLRYVHNLVWVASRLREVAHQWFDRNGIVPLALTYERLVADFGAAIRDVLAFLDLDASEVPITTQMRPQADAINAEWIERYRREIVPLPPGYPELTDPLPREKPAA